MFWNSNFVPSFLGDPLMTTHNAYRRHKTQQNNDRSDSKRRKEDKVHRKHHQHKSKPKKTHDKKDDKQANNHKKDKSKDNKEAKSQDNKEDKKTEKPQEREKQFLKTRKRGKKIEEEHLQKRMHWVIGKEKKGAFWTAFQTSRLDNIAKAKKQNTKKQAHYPGGKYRFVRDVLMSQHRQVATANRFPRTRPLHFSNLDTLPDAVRDATNAILMHSRFHQIILWSSQEPSNPELFADEFIRHLMQKNHGADNAVDDENHALCWCVLSCGAHSLPVWHLQLLIWGDLPSCYHCSTFHCVFNEQR